MLLELATGWRSLIFSPTGVFLRVAPFTLMLAAGCAYITLIKRRKEEEEA